MTDDFVVRDSTSGEVVYRAPYPTSEEMEANRRIASEMADGLIKVFGRPPALHSTPPIPGDWAVPYMDDSSVSADSIRRQLHIWHLEDQLKWDRSACLWFNNLEQEPPTMGQLCDILTIRDRRAAVVEREREWKPTMSKQTAALIFLAVAAFVFMLTTLMLVFLP